MSLQDYYHAAKEFNEPFKTEVVSKGSKISLLTCDQAKKMIQNRVDECVADICTEIVSAIWIGVAQLNIRLIERMN